LSRSILIDDERQADRREAVLLGLAFGFLLASVIGLNLAPAARQGDWVVSRMRLGMALVLPVWAVCAGLIRWSLRRNVPWRDPYLLPVGMLLTGWGILLIWRLYPAFGVRQLMWLAVGTIALVAILHSPDDLRWLRRYRYLWWAGGVLLTSLTLVFGTHPSGGEPRLWLGCCGVYFQPSEPLRLLLIAFLASYFSERLKAGDPLAGSILPVLAPVLAVWGLSIGLLIVQRDLGTGSLFVALLAVLLYLTSGRWQVLLAGAGVVGLGGALGSALFSVVRVRFQAWLNPWLDPLGGSYQIVQSLIALASGGVIGSGPGLGSPGFVPAAHTDFIFAALVEEWGLAGGLAALGLIAVLVSRGLKAAMGHQDVFAKLLAAGLATAFGLQSVLIIGGVIRLFPLTGVTLPFISYGGSSLLTSFIALGFLLLLSDGGGGWSPMGRPLRAIQLGLGAMLGCLALMVGWWTVAQRDNLVARGDNPRPALASLYVRRGSILDRIDVPLAESHREAEGYERLYPASLAPHVVGYDSLALGQAGLEAGLDPWLRGERGYDPWFIARQQMLTGFPPPGLNVRLTLDSALQGAAEEVLEGRRGAVVIMEAGSGEVLAMASAPSFDPNRLEEQWTALRERDDAPLLNRVTQARYQPGLAIAPFLAAWAQDSDLLPPSGLPSGLDLEAPIHLDGQELECLWPVTASGEDLAAAFRSGCPAPFAQISDSFTRQALMDMIGAFGLADPTGTLLPEAPAADLSVPSTRDGIKAEALGQGSLTVTPLQMARAWSSLFNAGSLPAVRLVDSVRMPDGVWQELEVTPNAWKAVSAETAAAAQNWFQVAPGSYATQGQAIGGDGGERVGWVMLAVSRPGGATAAVMGVEEGDPAVVRSLGIRLLTILAGASKG
jgi:cell division protein FtsW (lipid II flippase)